jgi:hypothetical protein
VLLPHPGKGERTMPEKSDEFSREEVTTEEHSFDELARGVADGTLPRGKALKSVFAALVGGLLGSSFALPPRDAEARELKTLWAVVNSNATLAHGKGVVSISRFAAVGSYVVRFNRNVSTCAYVATLSNQFVGQTSTDDFFGSDEVLVLTSSSSGTLADMSFHLVVNC